MDTTPSPSIEGHLLQLGDAREVALYRRDGTLWAAEFANGRCEILEAARWFATRDGARALAHARRRHLRAWGRISADLAETIECLHFILAPSGNAAAPVTARAADESLQPA